jgi:hypothetical protein
MIAGIVALLGAVAGFMPAVVQWLTLKANNAHELAMAQLKLDAARQGAALEVDRSRAEADVRQADRIYDYANQPSGYRFVDALVVLVRPLITFCVFGMWMVLTGGLFVYAVNSGYDLGQIYKLLWDEQTSSIFAAIIGFWFGNRMMVRGQQTMAATMAVTQNKVVKG